MSRTLVISDLHIGSRLPSAAERPPALAVLIGALAGCDRLVLLGDIVELREGGPPERAMATAAPILSAIGRALGPHTQIVYVPGNHDRPLIAGWLQAQGASLALESVVPADASPMLAELVGWLGLGGGRVTVRYPGVRLSGSVWATHGHYLDRHLLPAEPWGVLRHRRRVGPAPHAVPWEYERRRRRELSPLTARLPEIVRRWFEDGAEMARAATMPQLHARVLRPRLAPLAAAVLGAQTRRHSLPALDRALCRLGVDADWVVFGHVHRLGPLPGEPHARWAGRSGRPRFVNSGSWRFEPRLVHGVTPPHPYWPGGAVVIDDGQPPRPAGLLDALGAASLARG